MAFRLIEATIDTMRGAMQEGEISSRELVQLYLQRIEAYDHAGPNLNSVQTRNPAALKDAERLDDQLRAAPPIGPLHGVPVLIKDQLETSDMPTTYGSALFKSFVPSRNATIVEKLRAAGAVILAKNTMSEYALPGYHGSAYGVCRNPYDPTRMPGGSSCGTGASVAANLGAVGVGEDTGGSIRNPSANNALVGLRPTVGLVSRFGILPGSPTRDTLGPMARTLRDAAILLDVLAGYDPGDPVTAYGVGHVPASYADALTTDSLKGKRLGVVREPLGANTNPEAEDYKQVWAAIDRALADMANQGAEIVDPLPVEPILALLGPLSGIDNETEAALDRYLAAHPNAPVKTLREIVTSAEGLVHPGHRVALAAKLNRTTQDPDYLKGLLTREELRQQVLKLMADQRLDALVYPTMNHAAAPIPDDILTGREPRPGSGSNSGLSSATAFPALTVPSGFTTDGLPIGLSLFGRPFSEALLLQMAYAYEQATLHRRPPSTTPALPGEP